MQVLVSCCSPPSLKRAQIHTHLLAGGVALEINGERLVCRQAQQPPHIRFKSDEGVDV